MPMPAIPVWPPLCTAQTLWQATLKLPDRGKTGKTAPCILHSSFAVIVIGMTTATVPLCLPVSQREGDGMAMRSGIGHARPSLNLNGRRRCPCGHKDRLVLWTGVCRAAGEALCRGGRCVPDPVLSRARHRINFCSPRTQALRQLPGIGNLLTAPAQAFDHMRFRQALLECGSCEMAANMLWGGRFLAIPGGVPIAVRVVRAPVSRTRAGLLTLLKTRANVGCPDADN